MYSESYEYECEYELVVRIVSKYAGKLNPAEVDEISLMNLGVDSLSLLEIFIDITEETGIELPEELLTIREIASYLEENRS